MTEFSFALIIVNSSVIIYYALVSLIVNTIEYFLFTNALSEYPIDVDD